MDMEFLVDVDDLGDRVAKGKIFYAKKRMGVPSNRKSVKSGFSSLMIMPVEQSEPHFLQRPVPKEYIQSSRLDQCALQASQSEQYVTLEIPSDLVENWKREGYTHLHLGGIRLILTLHGRKGLPVTARIALLDTRFKQYQHAVIGTVLTTLHADLPTPYTTTDALMILADTDTIPTIVQIPKQIHKQELLKLMPLKWLTNYEHFHQNSKPVQTTEATFERRQNGQVKLSFQTPKPEHISVTPRLSYTTMITAVQTGQEKKLSIHGFSSEGYPIYPDKINGHFLWDVPEAHMCNPACPCLDDTDIEDELEVMRRKKKKKKKPSHSKTSCKYFPPLCPPDPKPPVQPIRSCLMFSSQSYEESFPPLEKQTDTQTRVVSKPFIQSPVTASGKRIDRVASQVSQIETKVDSISHRFDQMYIHLQDRISELDTDLRRMINNHIWGPEFNKKEAEIRKLKAELARIDAEQTRPTLFTQTQSTQVPPPMFETYSPFYAPPRPHQPVSNQFFGFSHLQPTPQPKSSSPKKSKSKVKISEPKSKPTSSSSVPPVPLEDSSQATPEPPKRDKGPMDQYHYHTVHSSSPESSEPEIVCESTPSESNSFSSFTNSTSTSTDSESEYADITSILMVTKTEDPSASTSTPIVEDSSSDDEHKASHTEPVPPMPPPIHDHSTKPSSASWFTFDDIPRHKWPARLQEFAAWIDLQGTKPNAQSQVVLSEFMARYMESSDSDDILVISTVQNVNHVSTIPRPSLRMSIFPSKFHKLVPVIGFIDTGADTSMIDPFVLPSDYWEPHSKLFRAVNGETFETTLITKKPIGIQFFLNCIILKKIVASKLPDKDLLIGFDILHLVKNLFLTNSGVRYKQMFLPYTDTLRLYALSKTPSPYSHLSHKFLEFCPENHSQFHHPSPLWKNEQFFIHLPFKLNEDINLTKASHPGMSPSDFLLAKQECSQLLQQGLIELTDSDWACQAFYVEKRSELVRGKKRLVIDYQPLNSFLKDDKFPLLKIQTLFVHLHGTSIFSKFDLKAGFWQLGISPVDRHKTAFCIPDAHYEWTVLPFGLKIAPSLFQKAMTKIFSPILHHALAHGIMLSEKKSSIGKESIDFLGMVIKDGHYQPGPHIATELLKFPDTNFTKKQIQQFLGIVNYVRDFIPKVAIHTSQLSRMLKKQCPPWGPTQIEAVKQLKVIAQSPHPLRIPIFGQRILQTDASDDYWSAILLEEIHGVRHFCAHAYRQFKHSEKNYHVIYKEILVVKKGLPVTAHLAMLDTRFKQYQDAVIGTVLTTLHAGSVLLTFYPNFNLSLQDPNLPTTLKVQVQIQGYPVYPANHNGHFLWDAPGSGICDPTCPCWDDWEEDDDYVPRRKRKPKRKKPPVSCHHYDPKPPQDPPSPPAPLPYYQKELQWIAKQCRSETPSPIPLPTPPLTCMMFSSTSSDSSSSFPPLEPHTDSHRNVVSKPFIPSPITSTGHLEPPKPFESVLNWQTQNARAQNDTLLNINSKIHQNLQSRITQLDSDLRAMLAQRYYGLEFDQKERKIRRLKAELAQIESEKQRPTLFTTSPLIPSIGPTYHPFASMLSPIRQYDPSKLFCMTHTLFRDNPLPPPPKPKPKLRPQPRPVTFHIPGQHSPGHTPASPPVPSPPTESQPPSQSKDKQPMHQFSAHTVDHSSTTDDQTSDSNLAVFDSHIETNTESSVSTSDSEKSYADITRILMA
ncbi:hypothetical protein KPL71_011966 [Citrus sinensis]|uniref:Uncharacterized protein n=1 Tax=Citrus sinensis TaxID=2711 RepID=A0ACB8L7K1_CITSI|nr:hypothetical protein KPL71_011966 [Citrus sinensis]